MFPQRQITRTKNSIPKFNELLLNFVRLKTEKWTQRKVGYGTSPGHVNSRQNIMAPEQAQASKCFLDRSRLGKLCGFLFHFSVFKLKCKNFCFLQIYQGCCCICSRQIIVVLKFPNRIDGLVLLGSTHCCAYT